MKSFTFSIINLSKILPIEICVKNLATVRYIWVALVGFPRYCSSDNLEMHNLKSTHPTVSEVNLDNCRMIWASPTSRAQRPKMV